MSTHTKKKIVPHKHFQTEIEEIRQVRPDRPAYKGVHASDVVVDSTLLLSKTIVEWTRHWEAEDCDFPRDSGGSIISDATASKEQCTKTLSTDPTGNLLGTTPREANKLAGDYYAIFRLKVESNGSSSDICKIQAYAAGLLGETTLKPSDFPASLEWHYFAIRVKYDRSDTNSHLVVYFYTGVTNLYIDWLGLVPAHVPIGYADVTVVETDPSSSADSTDPSSGADSTDPSGGADSTDPSTTGDNVDPSTINTSNDGINLTDLFTSSWSGNKNLTDSESTILSTGAITYPSGGIDCIVFHIIVNRISGYSHVKFTLESWFNSQWNTIWRGVLWIDDYEESFNDMVFILARSYGTIMNFRLRGECQPSGSVTVNTMISGKIFKTHSHTISGDSHTTPISNDAHPHTVSGDAHPHTVSGDAHPHTVSGDAHAHSDTEGGHEH